MDRDSAGWADESDETAVAHEGGDGILAAGSVAGEILGEEGKGDVEDVDLGAASNLQTQAHENLGDDEGGPKLLGDDNKVVAPPEP